MINARGESAADKAPFDKSFEKRRCLVIADGFYEWKRTGPKRVPIYFTLNGGRPFGSAGLWTSWKSPEGEWVPTCTIVTTSSNALVETVHDRMPVILSEDAEEICWTTIRIPRT